MRWFQRQREQFQIEGFTIGIPLTPISITIKRRPEPPPPPPPPPPPSGVGLVGAGLLGLAAGALLAGGDAGDDASE